MGPGALGAGGMRHARVRGAAARPSRLLLQAGVMRTEGPPVIVEPPVDGRRVVIRGEYFGTAHSLADLLRYLWLAGYDAGTVSLTDPGQVEWRGGGAEAW